MKDDDTPATPTYTRLTKADSKALVAALAAPPKPTRALRELFERHQATHGEPPGPRNSR